MNNKTNNKSFNTRKLIAHGPSSLTIALPRKWIKKYELVKGDEVSVSEDDKGLRVMPTRTKQEKSTSIKVIGFDEQVIISIMTTIYRRGYDKLTIKYQGAKQYATISEISRRLPGLTIIENTKGKCAIKSLSTELDQDFTTLFRRVFLIILQELDDLNEIIEDAHELKRFYHRDADLNALINLAVRMINKGSIQDRQSELYIFYSLLQLEEMGDDLVKFSIDCTDLKNMKTIKPAIKACSKMLRMLYDSYFTNKYSIDEFYKYYYLYFPDFPQPKKAPEYYAMLKKMSKKNDSTFYLRSFVEKVNSLAEILLLPKIDRN